MISIVDHIEYLIARHDCVVIPGWGALIAHHEPSRYDVLTRTLLPPRRAIGFNASVSHNDGLLAHSVMRRERVSYDRAMSLIGEQVATFRSLSAHGHDVSVGRIGYFTGSPIEFVPYERTKSADEYFGLPALHMKALTRRALEAELEEHRRASRDAFRHFVRRTWQAAAMIAAVLVVTLAVTAPRSGNNDSAMAGVGMTSAVTQSVSTPAPAVQQPAPVQPVASQGKYYLVICTLGSARQADIFMAHATDMQGRMQVLKRGRYYMVYIARSDNRNELQQQLNSLPSKYSDAWIAH